MTTEKFKSLMPPFTPDDCDIRHVQPYEANKEYLCPYCNSAIPNGLGHEVIVPRDSTEDRRHFHSGCWNKYSISFKK